MQDNDLLAIAERERAAFLEERNQTRRELDSVRERMNRLAVECERLKESCKSVSDLSIQFAKIDKANLDAKNAEIASLRKDREAWEAVERNQFRLCIGGRTGSEPAQFIARSFSGHASKESHSPRDAVLALAKELEGGK